MTLFRIAHPDYVDPFDGEGARRYGGRWNPKGVPLLYYATTLALAALEKRVHTPAAALGRTWKTITIEVPDALVMLANPAGLPTDWADEPAPNSTKRLGNDWVKAGSSLGLLVPSTIIPSELNALLNPVHRDLSQVRHLKTEDFVFDPRLAK